MVKNCGKCEHFVQMDGMFGGCTAGMREKFDHETFSSVPACKAFAPRAEENKCNCPNCRHEHLAGPDMADFGSGHPMGPMMNMLMNMPPGAMVMSGMAPPVGPCGPQGEPVEPKAPWVNPLVKNPKSPKTAKVVDLEAWKKEKGK